MSSHPRRAWSGTRGIEEAVRGLAALIVSALIVAALLLSAAPARGQTAVTEVKNADETTVLRIHEDGGLLGVGEFDFDAGTIPAKGAGTRLMWHPAKAAFRAGRVHANFGSDGTQWDEANVGGYSVAFGLNTTASGFFATAMGANTTASGDGATAMGHATASGDGATAIGTGTASGDRATALGRATEASEFATTAMGSSATASGAYATAMGRETEASGGHSTAMGRSTTAQAHASLVIGRFNVVAGRETSWDANDPLFVAGNGSGEGNRSNALTLEKDGDLSIAGRLTERSDRRLKTEVQPLGPALAKLNELQPVRFRFKDGTGHPAGRQLGLVAQEVEQAFPTLVSRGASGYLSVAYPKLTTVLLKGLQEQQTQIEEQEAQIQALKTRVDALEQGGREGEQASLFGRARLAAWILGLALLSVLLLRRRRGKKDACP